MFERQVLLNDGVYRSHEVIGVNHVLGGGTTVHVASYENPGREGRMYEAWLDRSLDDTLGFAGAEEWVMALPEFEEYVDENAELVEELASMLTDEQAATVPQAYGEWQPDAAYAVGDRRRYSTGLYKCLQPHTSQADQTPDVTVSLWAAIIASEDPDQPLPWVQPDSTNPYMKGDRVTHNGKVWESDIDYNVFEPGVAGWTDVA